MASDALKLTAQIVISHASMSELTTDQLVEEIKEVYGVLSSMESGVIPESMALEKAPEAEVKKPPIPLKDIVTQKYVVCLDCGKKMRTLKAHIRKAHGLMPKEYFNQFGLDPKKYPLV
jgi:predicted transcriptional regulator